MVLIRVDGRGEMQGGGFSTVTWNWIGSGGCTFELPVGWLGDVDERNRKLAVQALIIDAASAKGMASWIADNGFYGRELQNY